MQGFKEVSLLDLCSCISSLLAASGATLAATSMAHQNPWISH